MSVRPDDRLDGAPMQPVVCGACEARVLVRKSSWEQTSVQWDAAALQRCPRRREAAPRPGFLQGCSDLRESIEAAVHVGALSIVGE